MLKKEERNMLDDKIIDTPQDIDKEETQNNRRTRQRSLTEN